MVILWFSLNNIHMKNVQERDELRQSIIQQCGGIDGTMVVDVGEYVMVKWSESLILPGLVTEVTDSDDENVQVLSMKKSGDLYVWPCVCGKGGGVICCEEDACRDLEWIVYGERVLPGIVDLSVRGRTARGYSMLFTPE